MHIVRLSLSTTEYHRRVFEKRFYAISHIHNVMVKHAKKCLIRLNHDKEYLSAKEEYCVLLKKNKLSKEEKVLKKQLATTMNTLVIKHGLSEYDFQAYLKVCRKRYSKCIASSQAQKEATRVWKGVEEVLYGNGKNIHFKKYRDFDTIGGEKEYKWGKI